MAYLSAINGAKGIIFYMHGRKGDSYYIREHDDHWRYLAGLGAELREMSPILIAPAPPQKARADQPGLDVVLKQHEDKLFLLAANHDSEGPAEDGHFPGRMLAGVRLEADGLPDGRAESIGSAGTGSAAGGRVLKMAAGRIVDTFDAYAVHLYRLIPDTYGCPWNADGLANLEIGKQQGRRISFRFRAEHSGELESAALYLVFRALGYYHGDGGQVLLELQTDDGTPEHRPSGTVVASSLVQDPMAKWNRTFTFGKPPRLIGASCTISCCRTPHPIRCRTMCRSIAFTTPAGRRTFSRALPIPTSRCCGSNRARRNGRRAAATRRSSC